MENQKIDTDAKMLEMIHVMCKQMRESYNSICGRGEEIWVGVEKRRSMRERPEDEYTKPITEKLFQDRKLIHNII